MTQSSMLRPGNKAQAQLAANAGRKRGRASSKQPSLLAGLLFTAEGVPFTPSHSINHRRRYRYYVERSLLTPDAAKGKSTGYHPDEDALPKGWRLPAHEIEQLVLKQIGAFLRDREALLDALRFKPKSPDLVSAVLARSCKLAGTSESGSFASHLESVAALVRRITVAQDKVTIEIGRDALADQLLGQEARSASQAKNHQPIKIEVPVRFRRRGVEAKLLVLGRQHTEPDAKLIKALTRAHEWFGRIVRGEANGPGDIAESERLCRTYVTRVLCLAFLAPDITRSIVEGRQATELTTKSLIRSALEVPLLWNDQIAFISSLRPHSRPKGE